MMLDEVAKSIASIFLTYGLIGAVALIEAYIINVLYKRNQELHDTLHGFGQKVVESQNTTTNVLGKLAEIGIAVNKLTDFMLYNRKD